jgi:hypothetical protein
MSDSAFRKLAYATKLVSAETRYFEQVSEWAAKRRTLALQLADITTLVKEHRERASHPYEFDPKIKIFDQVPTIRLSNACEATANCLYSVAEIAANFGNKATNGLVPSSFNALRKKCEKNPSLDICSALGDLQWFRKIRELRTEWTHYSSIFIASGDQDEVLLCVRSFRRASDKVEFTTPNFSCTIDEFVGWVRAALSTLDQFAGYLLDHYILTNLPLDQTFNAAVYDKNGFPMIKDDLRFEVETITIAEYLRRGGIKVGG